MYAPFNPKSSPLIPKLSFNPSYASVTSISGTLYPIIELSLVKFI